MFDPRDCVPVIAATLPAVPFLAHLRNIDSALSEALHEPWTKRRRQNPDHLVAGAIEAYGLADDVRIASELLLPHALADDDDAVPSRQKLLRYEDAAHCRFDAERAEEPVGHAQGSEYFRFRPAREIESPRFGARHDVERTQLLAPIDTIRWRHLVAYVGVVPLTLPDQDRALRIAEGQRAEEQRVDDAKDADRGADSEGKDEDPGNREARAAAQQAQAVPHVVNQLRIACELPPQPGGVVEGAEGPAKYVHLLPPAQFIVPRQPLPALAELRLPFLHPRVAVAKRHHARHDAQDDEAKAEYQAGFHRLPMRGASVSSAR